MPEPKNNQIWQRKKDELLVAVRSSLPASSHYFTRVQNLRTGRHFEVTASGLNSRYELVGYDESASTVATPEGNKE